MSIALHHMNDDNCISFRHTIRKTLANRSPSAISPFIQHTNDPSRSLLHYSSLLRLYRCYFILYLIDSPLSIDFYKYYAAGKDFK